MSEYIVMENDNLKEINSLNKEKVHPRINNDFKFDSGIFNTIIKKASWNVIVLETNTK